MPDLNKVDITSKLLSYFLKIQNGINIPKSEKVYIRTKLLAWVNYENNISILKEVKMYLKMVNKVELKRGNLDYEIRKLKGLNDYFIYLSKKNHKQC